MQTDPVVNRTIDEVEPRLPVALGTPADVALGAPADVAQGAPVDEVPTPASRPAESRREAILLVASIYVAVISMAALLWRTPLLLAALNVPICCFVLYRWRSVETLACFLTGFVLGPAGEFVAVAGGAWSYTGHDSLPIWLPLTWGIAVVVMKQIVVLAGAWVPNERRRDGEPDPRP